MAEAEQVERVGVERGKTISGIKEGITYGTEELKPYIADWYYQKELKLNNIRAVEGAGQTEKAFVVLATQVNKNTGDERFVRKYIPKSIFMSKSQKEAETKMRIASFNERKDLIDKISKANKWVDTSKEKRRSSRYNKALRGKTTAELKTEWSNIQGYSWYKDFVKDSKK